MTIARLRPAFTFTDDRLAELRAVVPEAFADGRVNWEALREALGELLEPDDANAEHFGLFWPGKREARRLAAMPSRGTLVLAPGEGVNEEVTRNIFIEGDNLEVLKLLQKSYAGRVKVIYIDPPYNTGSDFVYKDDFRDPLSDYLRKTGQSDDEGNALTTNTRADGRFHSNWLSMMYPRLRLARTLLADDGVIFVSIDDNEVHNLRAVLGEIFGDENFVTNLVWVKKKKGSHLSRTHRSMTEYVVAFARDIQQVSLYGEAAYSDKWQPLAKRTNAPKVLTLPPTVTESTLPNGRIRAGTYGTGTSAVTFLDDIELRDGRVVNGFRVRGPFVWTQPKLENELAQGTRIALSKQFGFNVLRHNQDEKIKRPTTLLNHEVGVGTNEDANEALIDLFGAEGVFQYPKPVSLIKYLINAVTYWDREGIVLDFFAGSCATGEAVAALNAEDGGSRQFICVQLPEPIREGKFRNVAQIGKERLRRALKRMTKRSKSSAGEVADKPGFSVLELRSSNFRAWKDYDGENVAQLEAIFDEAETPLVQGWTSDGLLTEVLLLQGFPLDSGIVPQKHLKRNDVRLVTSEHVGHRLWVCFDRKVSAATVNEIEPAAEDVVVCLDSALDDEAKLRLADRCTLETI